MDELLLIAARALQFAFEDLVPVRVQCAKPEVLELQFDCVEAEALGDRRVDLERFARDAPPLHGRHHAERAHVVHAVGELDHDDADVPHHGEEHLAKALRLRFLAILELDLIEFADAVDEFSDDFAEHRGDLRLGGRGVLDDVVQDRGNQRIAVQPQIGEDVGDRYGVRDVGLARDALLPLMAFGAEVVGLPHALDLRGRQIGLELV